MSKARSPRYPVIGLREALEKVRVVYEADYQNRIPKELVAKHMGYGGLNGKSLGVISAVSKFGLLEGGADQMWVSDEAVMILEGDRGDGERSEALRRAAGEPELFADLDNAFPGKVSDAAIRSFLITKRKFLPDAADRVVRSYRETKEVVEAETQGYDAGLTEKDSGSMQQQNEPAREAPREEQRPYRVGENFIFDQKPAPGTRREVVTLDEGDVVITFPEGLSAASVDDLKDHLDLFIRKAQRRSGMEKKDEAAH